VSSAERSGIQSPTTLYRVNSALRFEQCCKTVDLPAHPCHFDGLVLQINPTV